MGILPKEPFYFFSSKFKNLIKANIEFFLSETKLGHIYNSYAKVHGFKDWNESKKIRTKKYRISFLFGNCRMIDSTSIGEPEVFDGGKINIPITLTYPGYEKR